MFIKKIFGTTHKFNKNFHTYKIEKIPRKCHKTECPILIETECRTKIYCKEHKKEAEEKRKLRDKIKRENAKKNNPKPISSAPRIRRNSNIRNFEK